MKRALTSTSGYLRDMAIAVGAGAISAATAERLLNEAATEIDRLNYATAEKWTPVSERLPEREKWVLVHNGKWTGVGAYMYEDDDSECWQDERREFIEHLGPKVTHWQSLPSAPVDRTAKP